MSMWSDAQLATLNGFVATSYDDVGTFEQAADGYGRTRGWTVVAGLENVPMSVTPTTLTDELVAEKYVGREGFTLAMGVTEDVRADAISTEYRVRIAARDGLSERTLTLVSPAKDVQRVGKWIHVFAVAEDTP